MAEALAGDMDSATSRGLAIEAAEVAADLVAAPEVAARWEQPSALDGMTVGALAAHLVRATGATLAYLDRTDPDAKPEGELLTRRSYFHAAVDSPIHDRIKTVSADEAAVGPEAVAATARKCADDMANRLPAEPADRLIGALGGRMLTLDDFCRTRLIEILMHVDDLATSVDLVTPTFSATATGEVIDILVGIAREQRGDWAVIHGLGRAERLTDQVFPVL